MSANRGCNIDTEFMMTGNKCSETNSIYTERFHNFTPSSRRKSIKVHKNYNILKKKRDHSFCLPKTTK